ncbi:E3 ubiquitin-protein ligase MARCHF2 isoform X3 [Vidua macroura]|uniref:E3 ubiquitin-protein ligase MARCHF2 isoform X3 n=1 Tax=Vidua macroura TaxID=187451 RepID=UPI0023A7C3A8|nr:E3 ubiquitin-protein ligase MARCHF2 isoform X3 [Vidua macroura]
MAYQHSSCHARKQQDLHLSSPSLVLSPAPTVAAVPWNLSLCHLCCLPGAGPGTEGPRAAMTTGDCCHLPGSLCDCPGSAALSKSVEESDMGRPQYITQVTAKDGRLLSTVIKALGAQSDGPICRICHEGGNGEGLLSPCDCTGTLGTVHKSCLEKWLSSSNTSYCELCHTEFVVERRPRPLTEALLLPAALCSSQLKEKTGQGSAGPDVLLCTDHRGSVHQPPRAGTYNVGSGCG